MWILGLKGSIVVRKPVPCVEEGYMRPLDLRPSMT